MQHRLAFGWSDEVVQMMTDTMKNIFGMSVIEPGLKMLRRPGKSGLGPVPRIWKEDCRTNKLIRCEEKMCFAHALLGQAL
jgi:hypothetical protein